MFRQLAFPLDLGKALFDTCDSAIGIYEVLEGDFVIFPGVRDDGLGWWVSHEVFELHGRGVNEPHRDSIVAGTSRKLAIKD